MTRAAAAATVPAAAAAIGPNGDDGSGAPRPAAQSECKHLVQSHAATIPTAAAGLLQSDPVDEPVKETPAAESGLVPVEPQPTAFGGSLSRTENLATAQRTQSTVRQGNSKCEKTSQRISRVRQEWP